MQDTETVQPRLVFLEEWSSVDRFGAKGMIWCLMHCNGPLRKHVESFGTHCGIMVGLSGNGPSQIWKRPRTLPTKMTSCWGWGQRSYCDPEVLSGHVTG